MITRGDAASVASASPRLRRVSVRLAGVARTDSNTESDPGSVAASLHFALIARYARTASHSRGAATARKSCRRTICAWGCRPATTDRHRGVGRDRRRPHDACVPHAVNTLVLHVSEARGKFCGNIRPRIGPANGGVGHGITQRSGFVDFQFEWRAAKERRETHRFAAGDDDGAIANVEVLGRMPQRSFGQ